MISDQSYYLWLYHLCGSVPFEMPCVKSPSTISCHLKMNLRLIISVFLQAHLVDLAEKDATKKSDAAREAFLAELAQDSKKGGTIIDGSKHVHERARDKKKYRDNPKNNDQKVCNTCDHMNSLFHLTSE